jgi:hypothetical protein
LGHEWGKEVNGGGGGVLAVWLFGCLVVWLFGCLVAWFLSQDRGFSAFNNESSDGNSIGYSLRETFAIPSNNTNSTNSTNIYHIYYNSAYLNLKFAMQHLYAWKKRKRVMLSC